jgi:hypothetical protein
VIGRTAQTAKTPRKDNSVRSKLSRSAKHRAEWEARTEEGREEIYQARVRKRELPDLRSRLSKPAGRGRGGSFLRVWPCRVLLPQLLDEGLHPQEITRRLREYERQVLGAEQLVIQERVAFEAEDPEPCGSSNSPAASILKISAPPPGPSQSIVVIQDE